MTNDNEGGVRVERTVRPCPNCKELKEWCACMRNTCIDCGKPVGNITFTCCDACWDIHYKGKTASA